MASREQHSRAYLQSRIREEIGRQTRYGHPFALLVLEALPDDGQPLRAKLEAISELLQARVRPSDVVALAFDDTIVVLLVETEASGADDVLFRLRGAMASTARSAGWRIERYCFPADGAAIGGLALMTAA